MKTRGRGPHVQASRRRFLTAGARAASVGLLAATPLTRAVERASAGASAASLPAAQKRILDRATFTLDLGPFAPPSAVYHGNTFRDYSGSIYCPIRKALLMFGGGHAATPADVVLSFPLARLIDGTGPELAWQADYAPTPLETMSVIETATVSVPPFDAAKPRAAIDLQPLLGPLGTMLRQGKVSIADANGQPVTGFTTFYWEQKRGVLFANGTTAPQPFKVTFQYAKYLTPGGFWKVPGQVPPIRPISRHTYEATIWSNATSKMLVLCGNNGASYHLPLPVADAATGGNCAAYDPSARTWEDTGIPGLGTQAVEDPVSGNVLTFSRGTFAVYDPRRNSVLRKGNLGREIGFFAETYVHYPPNDRFYLLRGGTKEGPQRAVEIVLDRTTWNVSLASVDDVNYRPRARSETTYRYDAASQLIVGSIQRERDGRTYAYAFRPLARGRGEWLTQVVPDGGGGTQMHHAIYVPDLRAHAFLTAIDKRIDLVLWRPDPRAWVTPKDDAVPEDNVVEAAPAVPAANPAIRRSGNTPK